ncbi:unnamed protein product [Adineta steineri]|uniref:Uncharacterized protein n=1 Tax=Adineta steineri TaxID=433720 RepID=A0A816CRS8_9BILA|nr:unnamed protein product [Adineta steineri]CAF1628793.1 unnamed protein product [Adineta steineri]
MSFDLNCLNVYNDIPLITNKSNNIIHPIYKPNGDNFLSKFSSLIIHSSFSSDDLQLYIKNSQKNSLKFPSKMLSSLIIYSSIILILLIISTIIFYIISSLNFNKRKLSKNSFLKLVSIIFLNLIYLFILIQMIYIIININNTKLYLNKSIKQINSQMNSETISQYLLKQFQQFSSKSTSIIVNGSKSIMIKSFSDYYDIKELNLIINNINEHLDYFNSLIVNNEILTKFFRQFTNSYRNLLNLNRRICDYINKNDNNEIEKKIFYLKNLIEEQMKFFIEILNGQILNKINFKLFNNKQQDKIHSIISFITNFIFIIISILIILPFTFLIIIISKYFFFYKNHRNNNRLQNQFQSLDVRQLQSSHIHSYNQQSSTTHPSRSNHKTSSKKSKSRKEKNYHRNPNGERSSSLINNNQSRTVHNHNLFLCLIRINFGLLVIFLIILSLITSLLYGIDMILQSSCQVIHYDQPFLISYVTDNFIKSIDDFDVNATLNNLINDCSNNIHFSKKFLEKFSLKLDDELIKIIEQLNINIYNQFQSSIPIKNISSEFHLFNNFVNLTGLTTLHDRLVRIENNFNKINQKFTQIIQQNSKLSNNFMTKIINQFKLLLERILESTIDSCPLPINDIYKIDELICHKTTNIINGLWMKILLFIFTIVFGLYIFGIYIYKQLN